jgi:hypothetical protein
MLSQEEILNKQIQEEKRQQHYQLILRTIVFVLLFYVLTSPVILKSIKNNPFITKNMGSGLFTTVLFGVTYYAIHVMFI